MTADDLVDELRTTITRLRGLLAESMRSKRTTMTLGPQQRAAV